MKYYILSWLLTQKYNQRVYSAQKRRRRTKTLSWQLKILIKIDEEGRVSKKDLPKIHGVLKALCNKLEKLKEKNTSQSIIIMI